MKSGREDTENPSPAAKRQANQSQASPEVELALARQRIEFMEEKAGLEKHARLEKRELEEKARLEKRALEEKARALETRALEEKARLEKRALVAEHKAALLESEKRLVAEHKAALLESEKRLVAEHRAAVLESKQKGEEKKEEPQQEARSVAGRASDEFPWLTVQVFTLPEDLLTHTATFITDDDLFGLRGVSRTFYRAFYSQRNSNHSASFNSWRAVQLASKGRVFPKLEKLTFNALWDETLDTTLTWRKLAALGPQHFPKLTKLNLVIHKHQPLSIMPSHPNLTLLETRLAPFHDDRITALRFPALKTLCVNVYHKEAQVVGHPGLEILEVWFDPDEESFQEIVESFDWASISREAFPSLKTVVDESLDVPVEVKARLEAEGIEVTFERAY